MMKNFNKTFEDFSQSFLGGPIYALVQTPPKKIQYHQKRDIVSRMVIRQIRTVSMRYVSLCDTRIS